MKKMIVPVIMFSAAAIFNPTQVSAFWGKTRPAAKAAVKPQAKPAETSSDSRKIESRTRQVLAGRDWLIYLNDIEGKKGVTDVDVLTFSEGKFVSKSLSNKGYPASNFTIAVLSGGTVEWESSQVNESGDISFWKGQLQGETIRGVLSLHTLKGQLQDFYFTNKAEEQK